MRTACYSLVFSGSIIFAAAFAAGADEAVALQYAKDGVATLEHDYKRLQSAASAGTIPATVLERREDELFDARLLLYLLQKDADGIAGLLRNEVRRREAQLQRLQRMTERGYVGADQVSDATLRVLDVRFRLANHTNDEEMKQSALLDAVKTEEERLKMVIDLASRGYASRAAVAAQKLRIARIIATQEIVIPQISEPVGTRIK